MNSLEDSLFNLKAASRKLTSLSTDRRNAVLTGLADRLISSEREILEANENDLKCLDQSTSAAFRDRLTLNTQRIHAMAASLRAVAALPDPIGEVVDSRTLPNGLNTQRIRSPLGTLLMIFEARPNVITEVFALAFKTGNGIALRGGSESKATAATLYQIIAKEIEASGLTPSPFVPITNYDRTLVGELLKRADLFDVCIPRGGDSLIERVSREAKMPVIKNDRGLCHLYIHTEAILSMAIKIAVNAKTQRPSVCNAIETCLIDRAIAEQTLRELLPAMAPHHVRLHCCNDSYHLAQQIARTDGTESTWATGLKRASETDFNTEYLDLDLNIKIVDNVEAALRHIERFGSHHSEAIITENKAIARQFQREVDAACTYWNASTRFTDGFELGLGGEIGISTQKLHVRGPVGLKELMSIRWLIDGTGQIR
ncbi:MAG: glutamate-5-semialdehyde dehydrogenase [Bdellovibrionaceae bacterium]|nr:glutamate-5-semialdehyde dehydrogenase [Pseudobdellovibrionaceae bacterium]